MSYLKSAEQGLAAIKAEKWEEAVVKLSAALEHSKNPAWLLGRSRALANLKRVPEALADANLAWHKAYERNDRPCMVNAHYRRAVAYFRMGQYANADCCCHYAMRLVKGYAAVERPDPREKWLNDDGYWTRTPEHAKDEANVEQKRFSTSGCEPSNWTIDPTDARARQRSRDWNLASSLRVQALEAMMRLPRHDSGRMVTISVMPPETNVAEIGPLPIRTVQPGARSWASDSAQPAATAVANGSTLRIQDFQTNTSMTVSIFSKGLRKEDVQVEFSPRLVRVQSIVHPTGEKKELVLPLWGEVEAERCSYEVMASKVELKLAKKTPGRWGQLVAAESTGPANTGCSEMEEEGQAAARTSATPAYPSSSRSGPKDWDKIGDEQDDEVEDVNQFFKKLYLNANPEQQRAMMKSFTESNGTSLSTDWNDVKDRRVETVPPEGVEAKKWE